MGLPKTPKVGATYMVDPCDVTIIGLDTEDGVEHPLYDERIHTLAPVVAPSRDEDEDEDDDAAAAGAELVPAPLTVSVAKFGVRAPVLVQAVKEQDGWHYVVVDGRQRVRAARWVAENTGIAREIPVQITEIAGTEQQGGSLAAQLSVALNEIREDDDTVTRAEKMARLHQGGVPASELVEIFGLSIASVHRHLRFILGSPTTSPAGENLKAAVRAGAVPWSWGWRILGTVDGVRLPDDEVERLAKKALEGKAPASVGTGAAARKAARGVGQKGRTAGQKNGGLRVSDLRLWCKKAPAAFDGLPEEARAILSWVLDPTADMPASIAPFVEAGMTAAAAKGTGKAGRKAQAAGSVVEKTKKDGTVVLRAVNAAGTVGLWAPEFRAEAEAWASGDAPMPAKVKSKKAEAAEAAEGAPAPAKKGKKAKKTDAEAEAEAKAAEAARVAALLAAAEEEDEDDEDEVEFDLDDDDYGDDEDDEDADEDDEDADEE